MKSYEAMPLKSAAGISFGMSRAEARKAAGLDWIEFKKSKYGKNTADDFGDFHVYYDVDDKCVAVEFFGGCKVVVDGKTIMPANVDQAESALPGLIHDQFGLLDAKQSIGITDTDGNVETVLFGKKGYYES